MKTKTATTAPRPTGWKLLLLATLPVVLVVLLAELALHLVGFPHDPETLLRAHFVPAGKGWMVTRPLYTRIETSGHPQRLRREKGSAVLRVALLGGSSVRMMGDAPPLEEILERALGKDVQILNFGLCGCGTDRALVSARQALKLDVDAILLYSGHNEFISESNRKTYQQRGWLHRHSKILQLCIGNAWIPEPGKLYSPAEKEAIYTRSEQNLRELSRLCRDADVPLVWGTVPANLRIPPLVYMKGQHGSGELAPEPMFEFQRGADLYNRERYPEAKQVLQQAIGASPRPWRATWRNNLILRDLARELGVPFADVEQHVSDASPQAIPGPSLFTDHCHLNEDGYIILMKTFAEMLIQELQGKSR
ncbi:MAG: SGNH/GDSL hydrolase family protein [Verrucomicrobia bacterium]|jgi:hypothetical protein|nr:SGNH/GDSL hydrolase family protein [Verrucomicrobiota bacterium]MBT7065412.1 SGNH/GDSL hydrolase family protein [Verrucomicrobiota bacterium]MBT7702144.1 SGNH/GDSL hydrolase family protein [Verrucomicrobiota bacterium]